MSASQYPSFQGLTELVRRDGADIRPTLVRVLTDLYVQEADHPPAERARFSELACRLLDGVDSQTRAAVAERLASYPGTPPVVAARLARDEIVVADPVLRRSPALGEAELHSILDSTGIAHAVAIASRPRLPASVSERLKKTGARQPAIAVRANEPALTIALARRYLATGPKERRLILTALAVCPAVAHEERLRCIDRAFGEQLERAALRHRVQEFSVHLQRTAGLSAEIAARVVADPTGDPIIAICRALGMPFDASSRIVLFLNPEIGTSVQQVFGLTGWFEKTNSVVARRLVGAWCAMAPPHLPRYLSGARITRDPRDTRAVRTPITIRGVTPARPAAAHS